MDSSLISDRDKLSYDDFFETQKQDEQFKQTFVDTHRITLRLNDFDHKIEVPQKMLQYSSAEGEEDEKDGPFLMLELKNVERLIQKESANNSKNISNIKYFDEAGVWKEMEQKQRFSCNQLEKNSLETIPEEGNLPVKRKSEPFITVNGQDGQEGQGYQKFNFELRLSIEGFRKQNKRVLSRLQTKEYAGLQKNISLRDNSSSPSKPPKNFITAVNLKNEENQTGKVQLQEKFVVSPAKSQEGPITVGKSKTQKPTIKVSLPNQPSLIEETKETSKKQNSEPIAEIKPMIIERIPQDKQVTEPAKPQNKLSIKSNQDLSQKTLAKKPSTKNFIKKQAKDSESSHEELCKKVSVIFKKEQPSTVNTNKEATQAVADAQKSEFVSRSEFNKVVTALQSRVEELEAKINQILQRFDGVGNTPCSNTGRQSDSQGANTSNRQISIDNVNLKKNRSSFFHIHEDLPDVVFAFADVMQQKNGESEFELLPPTKMLQPDLMYEKITNQLKQVELDLIVKRTPLNYKKLQEILIKKMRIVFILCHGTLRKNTTNFCLENVDDPTELDELDEARLQELLHNKIQCQTIVISACHSSKLAEILHQLGNTDITVVAINSREPVLEKAAMTFNEIFLQRLLEHNNVNDAYEHAIGAVGAMVQKDSKCCCCDHKHKDDCLWLKYLENKGAEAAHELHTPKCNCCSKLKNGQNGHALDCLEYKKFQDALHKIDPIKFKKQAALQTNYAQMQQTSKDFCTMCCCCVGEVMHNESDKFVILGNKDKVVFPSDINCGDLKEYKCDLSQIQLSSPNLVDRNCRAEEKIIMIKFLMQEKQRVLNIMGESGVFDTLVKAVHYAVERSPKNYISKAVKINLDGIASVREITRKIFKQMMIFSQNPTEEDVISWFKHNTYKKNLSYLIIFDNYTHLEHSAYLLSQANQFMQNLIEETIKMKLIVISKSDSLELKQGQIKETIYFKPLQPQQLFYIFEDILTKKNQQNLIARKGKEYYKNHEIFKLQALGVSELYDIIDQLKYKSLDEIYEKIVQNWFKEKDPEIFNCFTRLQNSPKVIVDFVFLLSQIPRGICIEEIRHFKVLWPDFFEDKENLLDYVEIEEAAEEPETSNDLQKSVSQTSIMAANSEKSSWQSRRNLLYFFDIENLNELIEDQKFTLKTFRRDALNQLLVNPPQNQAIAYKTLQEYIGHAINFLCLYGTKMLTEMIKEKRKSEVDYNIITLHLDYGIWRLDRDSKCPNFNEFQKLSLTSVEERFEVIEQSFTCIFEDWHKISNYFKAGASEDEKNTVQDLFHLAKLIPSLLVELGRVQDAILFIQNLKEAATKLLNSDVVLTKLIAQMGLIQVSLQLSLNHELFDQLDYKNQKKKMKKTLDEIAAQFSKNKKTEETLQVLAETYYVYTLLQIQNDEQKMQQKQSASFAGSGFEMPMKELIFEHKKSIPKKKNLFQQKKSENMSKAIQYFKELKSDDYLFAISKCNLKYVRIVLDEEEAQEGISIEKKNTLLEILEKTDETCKKQGNWLQQTICKILKSKVLMAGIHSQADRDKAIYAINAARDVFKQKNIQDTWWLAEIVDQKQAILKEYMMQESQELYFNFAKANPIVELDDYGCVLPSNLPIRPNGSPIELFVRGPFKAEADNIRFPYKLDILTENLLKECVQQGIRLLHLSSDFDGSQGLAVEEEGWAKKMLSPENLKDLLLEAQGDQPCKLTLVVLLIPKSEKLAQVFYDIGVKHVIAFDQTQSKQMNKDLLTALQFNYIFAFCATLYKQIAQRLDLKTAFDKAKHIVNDDLLKQYISITKQEEKHDKHSKLHTRISLAQYQTIEDIGIKPILLQRPEASDLAMYSKNETPNFINCSSQQGIITGMLSEDINIYGHKEKLYQTLKWIWNDETNSESTSLVHVRGVKHSGKSLFLRTVGRIFYQRNDFPFKISYFDFHTVDSPAKFKKVIYEMDADLQASRKTTDNKIDNHSRDILWLLDNVNELTPTLWEQFELKLYKMCKMKNIKIVLSSTFQQEQKSTNPVFSFFEPARQNKEQGNKIYMQEIVLEGMTEDEALNILHSQCEAEFDENELDPDTTGSLNERIKQEPAFKDCKNLPGKIAALAKELSKKINDKFQTFADLRKKEQQYLRAKTKRISSSQKLPQKMEKTKSSVFNSQKSILKSNNQDNTRIDRSATFVSQTSIDRIQIEMQEDFQNSQTHESVTPQPLVKFKLGKKNHSVEFSQ